MTAMHAAGAAGTAGDGYRTPPAPIDPHARYRVDGHAGVWAFLAPAVVVTDEQEFEHPDGLVLMYQVADPENVVVVGPDEVTAYHTPALGISAAVA